VGQVDEQRPHQFPRFDHLNFNVRRPQNNDRVIPGNVLPSWKLLFKITKYAECDFPGHRRHRVVVLVDDQYTRMTCRNQVAIFVCNCQIICDDQVTLGEQFLKNYIIFLSFERIRDWQRRYAAALLADFDQLTRR
jgi:hypothetical protein